MLSVDFLPFLSSEFWAVGDHERRWDLVEYRYREKPFDPTSPLLWAMQFAVVRRTKDRSAVLRCRLVYPGGKETIVEFDLAAKDPATVYADEVRRKIDRSRALIGVWLPSDGELTIRHEEQGSPVLYHRFELRFIDGFPFPVVNYSHDELLDARVTCTP